MSRFFLDDYGFKMPEIPGTVAAPYVFSAQYQAVYDSFIVKPAADIAQRQDIMVRALVSAGIWAKLDAFYIFANNTAANAVINWINPGTYDCLEVNAPTFLAYRHYVGNGVNQYLNTQFNPVVAGGNYAQNDASFGIYCRNDISEVAYDMSARAAGVSASIILRSAPNFTHYINDNTGDAGPNANSQGFYIMNRVAVNSKITYKNGAVLVADATATTGVPNVNFFILCFNNSGAPALFSTKQAAAAFIGGGLTGVGNDVTNFTNALEVYLDYVGAGVI